MGMQDAPGGLAETCQPGVVVHYGDFANVPAPGGPTWLSAEGSVGINPCFHPSFCHSPGSYLLGQAPIPYVLSAVPLTGKQSPRQDK